MHMPIFGHTFFGHKSAIFSRIQETIIYRLVLINPSYEANISFLIFWATFGGKMGVASVHHAHPLWSGASKPDQKVGPLGGPFGSTAILKSCFRNFQAHLTRESHH